MTVKKSSIVSQRKKKNVPFRVSEEFFQNVVESLEDYAIITTDKDGNISSWNSGAKRLLGYSEREIIGKNAGVFFTSEDIRKNAHKKELAGALRYGSALDERFHVRKNGTHFWGSGQVFPLKDERGIVYGFTKIMRNRSSEQQVQQHVSHLAAIVESSSDAIISRDLKGIITTWNKGAEWLFGFTGKEAIGKHIEITMPVGLRHETITQKDLIKRQGSPVIIETTRRKKDGTTISVSVTLSPLKDAKARLTGVSIIARDITERKALEQQKDEFIGIASHELKTPVTSVKAYTQVLRNRFRKAHDIRSTELVQKMDVQIDKLTVLINDLLDVTKIEGGKLQLRAEYFDFNELIHEIVEEIQRTTQTHIMITQLKRTRTISGDRDRIGQVITNLLSNAIKYSPKASEIIVETKIDHKNITLCVRDFGVGISEKKQQQVFERFYRVSGPKENTFPGLGLGLYISSEIVKRQGGRIWVESPVRSQLFPKENSGGEDQHGSRFCFALPLRKRKSKND